MIVTSSILESLANYEIRDLNFLNTLTPFLNTHAVHFCHELYNFASSPYEIGEYDFNLQHTHPSRELTAPFYQEQSPPIIGEINVMHSVNEEPQSINIIEDSSRTDYTDVEIPSHSLRSTDPLNSSSIDQPSTSTGIRDSLDRQNDSFQSVYGGLSRVSYSSQVKRNRPNQ
ncbi:unnamed protein product [Macrosiphum euphorbiae]|uniref:Uncharacterized protein n=1 Tax=Macrosiphum euphorbiae TaxID=13131 RepID=A0AAV0Y137_9HEMI|nr:unnamed protein product [Macrosiphum euphorbiae]